MPGSERSVHWDRVFSSKDADEVTWYQPRLEVSLALIDGAGLPLSAPIIDVGAGASTLVDDLLDRGYSDITVLDISATALEISKQRLGARAEQVTWIVGDLTTIDLPPARYQLWHDRAVFHFMTDDASRAAYVRTASRALGDGGYLVVATFAENGPTRCSGLDAARYSAEALSRELGQGFESMMSKEEVHTPPAGGEQSVLYCKLRKVSVPKTLSSP